MFTSREKVGYVILPMSFIMIWYTILLLRDLHKKERLHLQARMIKNRGFASVLELKKDLCTDGGKRRIPS